MGPAVLLALALAQTVPPVLLEPELALHQAKGATATLTASAGAAPRRRAAEIQLLARDAKEAIRTIDQIPDPDPRALRIALDAAVQLQDKKRADRLVQELRSAPGWSNHADRQGLELLRAEQRRDLARFGGAMFAFALTVLVVGGAGALVRPTRYSWLYVGVLGAASGLAVWGSPLIGRLLALVFLAWGLLGHAAISAARRTAAPLRMRLFLVTLLGLGMVGVALAVLAPIPWPFVLEQVSRQR